MERYICSYYPLEGRARITNTIVWILFAGIAIYSAYSFSECETIDIVMIGIAISCALYSIVYYYYFRIVLFDNSISIHMFLFLPPQRIALKEIKSVTFMRTLRRNQIKIEYINRNRLVKTKTMTFIGKRDFSELKKYIPEHVVINEY